ncbi:MAG: nicotinate (nicotinamide) nucleotide adenylyltransferase [Armatimonadetes bacterium]|nr:nicotinate (nicotinamide) nucleotide adenylyltransferase [Armatimonadota bacterium]
MRLGILGGTFDPIHFGHLRLAVEAKEALKLDDVVLEVAAQSPFKLETPPTEGGTRCEMVKCALDRCHNMRVGNVDLRRSGPSYTIDTVQAYAEPGTEVWLIVGTDALSGIPKWKDPERLLQMCRIGVGFRPGQDFAAAIGELSEHWRKRIRAFPTPLLEISSTDIRKRVANGQSVRYMTPQCVVQIIERSSLYRIER